jgi:hypothetical protein
MVNYNLTPFTAMTDDPARLKHMATVKASLQTVYDGKIENLRLHIQDFTSRMQNTGLYKEFSIGTTENPRPVDIPMAQWTFDHPLHWQTANFIENFNSVTLEALKQEKDRIDDTLEMLAEIPESADFLREHVGFTNEAIMFILTLDKLLEQDNNPPSNILFWCSLLSKKSRKPNSISSS